MSREQLPPLRMHFFILGQQKPPSWHWVLSLHGLQESGNDFSGVHPVPETPLGCGEGTGAGCGEGIGAAPEASEQVAQQFFLM